MSKFILGIDIDVPDIWYTDDCNLTEEEKKEATKDYINRLWYYKVYCALVDKFCQLDLKGNLKGVYTENHHILPKCMGGIRDKTNFVKFPAREHIMAHLLLHLAFPDNNKLTLAADLMLFGSGSGGNEKTKTERMLASKKFSTRTCGRIRENAAKSKSGINNGMYGRHHTDEAKAKMSKIHKGKIISEEQKKKVSEQFKGNVVSESVRVKISNTKKGVKKGPLSEETKQKLSKAIRARKSKCSKVKDSKGNIFSSIRECARFYNVSDTSVRYWLRKCPERGFKLID